MDIKKHPIQGARLVGQWEESKAPDECKPKNKHADTKNQTHNQNSNQDFE